MPEEQWTPSTAETEYRDRYQRARARVDAIRGFYIHLAVYDLVNLCLFAINMVSDPHSLWFYWPLLGWGVALAIHALTVFWPVAAPGSDWEQRKICEWFVRPGEVVLGGGSFKETHARLGSNLTVSYEGRSIRLRVVGTYMASCVGSSTVPGGTGAAFSLPLLIVLALAWVALSVVGASLPARLAAHSPVVEALHAE